MVRSLNKSKNVIFPYRHSWKAALAHRWRECPSACAVIDSPVIKKIAASCHSVLVFVLQRMVIKQQENIWLTAAKHKIYRRFSCRALISRSGKCSFQIKANPRWCTILVTSRDEHLKNSSLLCVNAFRLKTSSNTIINLWPIIDHVISQWLISHNA